jgi:two-component system cell cycle response regulator
MVISFPLSTPAFSSPSPESVDSTLPHILVVEDSLTSVAVISRDLREYYTLLHARDGEVAWEMLLSDPRIELVITDVQMPRLTGQQLLKLIRLSPETRIRNLPVIVMTTAEDSAEKHLAFLNGANDFLNKPVDSLELQARVNVHHRLSRTIYELEVSQAALAELATTDSLTKLKNRRQFYTQAEENLTACRRYGKDMSLLLLDIDYFKKVNDTFGHHAGDEVLVKVAELLSHMVRGVDTVARFGGEEFAVLLPETNRLGAAVLGERIRAAIEREQINVDGQHIPVTVSIGITTLAAEHVESIDQLLNIADQRLYLAKNSGRNRICVSDDGKSHFA